MIVGVTLEDTSQPERPGETRPRHHPLAHDGRKYDTYDDRVHTMYDSIELASSKYSDSRAMGWRVKNPDGTVGPYTWITFKEMFQRIKDFGSGLGQIFDKYGLGEQSALGIYSINRPEWHLAEYGGFHCNAITVALYDTLGDEAIEYICLRTEIHIIVVENLLALAPKLPCLKVIITMDAVAEEILDQAKELNLEVFTFDQVEGMGKDSPREAKRPKADDLCNICYTSGTSGMPKGVMIPHKAPISLAAGTQAMGKLGKNVKEGDIQYTRTIFTGDVYCSFLPLAHSLEFTVSNCVWAVGGCIGYYQGDILKLVDDFAELKPTILAMVPRLVVRIVDKVLATVDSGSVIKKMLFYYALQSKLDRLKNHSNKEHWLWDRLIFNKVREKLGGRLESVLVGSAPIDELYLQRFSVMFGCITICGYGMTETSGGSTLSATNEISNSGCGLMIPCNEIKLIDVPEMGYFSTDKPHPRGEVCIRGFNCFVGYYKDPENTKATLDDEGWVHSGDIGKFDEYGRLHIIDRRKNIFKLSQGEYVAAERIECILTKSPFIAQIYVEGNGMKNCVVAVVVPDMEVLIPWARENSIKGAEGPVELAAHPDVKELLMKEIQKFGKNGTGELKGFEIPANIYVEANQFTIENNLLTPTLKFKRNIGREKYQTIIDTLYTDINQ